MGPPQKWIVFCADDLGISTGTNEGILRAFEAGLVRETSLCVTGNAWKEGIEKVRDLHPELGMGLHLSFTLGKAVNGPISQLTDSEGNFRPLPQILKACYLKRLDKKALEAEVLAQLKRAGSGASRITHLNGHHHVHVFPQIRDVVIQVLKQASIPWIRLPCEEPQIWNRLSFRRHLLAHLTKSFRQKAQGLHLPAYGTSFVGLSGFDRPSYEAFFLKQLNKLKSNKAEWMLHPRMSDNDFASLDHLKPGQSSNHQQELDTLTNPEFVNKVLAQGVRPSRFGEMG
jgi:predicted glycoside hydrolase/deacetylase ChbG (UPF0249 family)